MKDVTLSFRTGEIIGFIGPNGSGKTTTMKMIAGLLHPTAGRITVGPHVPSERKKEFLRNIGFVMGQKGQLWWDLPALDSYDLLIDIYECDRKQTMAYVHELAERQEIADCLRQPVRMLSLGQRMKAELIGAILHRPAVLLLDEPTIGLDIHSARAIRNIIREEAAGRDMTIMLSSHILDDIQELCGRVVIINHGRVIYDDLLENCYEKYLIRKRIRAEFAREVRMDELPGLDRITEFRPFEVCWEVDRDQVSRIGYEIMQRFAVDDITIAEIPLFKTVKVDYAGSIFLTFAQFCKKPFDIYPALLRKLLLYVVPLGFVSWVPAAFLLGKIGTLWLWSFAVTPLLLGMARWMWNRLS